MFTIRVMEKDSGKPAKGVVVSVVFRGGLLGSTTAGDEYTDIDGDANFDYDPQYGTVYVSRGGFFASSQKVYEGELNGRKVVYIE